MTEGDRVLAYIAARRFILTMTAQLTPTYGRMSKWRK